MKPHDPTPLWIQDAHVIDPASGRNEKKADIFVRDGVFVEKLTSQEQAQARKINAQGLIACPGFIDLNCRLGEPGLSARESIRTGTHAAAAGGFTTVVTMPDTKPAVDNVGTLQLLREICTRDAIVRVLPTGTLTKGHEGKALAPLGSMKKAGVVAVTDTTSGVQNNEIMRRALEYAAMFNLVVLDHCQDSSMTEGAQMHEGAWSLRLGLRGSPRAAEEIVASSDCVLAELTKARIHLQHLSSGNTADIVRRAKSRGAAVTCEVSALHLLLNDSALENYDTRLKLNPPLREEADRKKLIEAVVDGTIDAICSDHSPCTATEKDCEFDLAPFGASTLEIAANAAYEALVVHHQVDLATWIARFTSGPARVLDLPLGTLKYGTSGDMVLFNPQASWSVSPQTLYSKAGNQPLLGKTFQGRFQATFVAGQKVFSLT